MPCSAARGSARRRPIDEIADRQGMVAIEDGSQAHGLIHAGRKVGTLGDAAGFSCMGGKLRASAEAGYMGTPHEDVCWKAALCAQHMGRSPEPGFPRERFGAYVDSLVYTYRLSPLIAVMLTEQVKKIDAENAGRRESVRLFRQAMAGVSIVRFPQYPAGDEPVYHVLTRNFDANFAGVSKPTFFSAIQAEGPGCFQYVLSPIPTWRQLHWQTYDGPRVMLTEPLWQSGIDDRELRVPNGDWKIAQSVEMGWNYIEPSEEKMARLASAFVRVEENLPALSGSGRRNRPAHDGPRRTQRKPMWSPWKQALPKPGSCFSR